MQNRKYYPLYDYRLSPAQARACRFVALVLLIVAVAQALSIGLALVAPRLLATDIHCTGIHCRIAGNPISLLPDATRGAVEASASAAERLERHLYVPRTRLTLMIAEGIASTPIVALLLFAAVAIGKLGQHSRDDLAQAIPWLRRASIAALVAVPLVPFGESVRTTVLLGAVRPGGNFHLDLDVNRFVLNLLLAGVAFAVTWALAAGSRAGQDIAEIV